MIFLSKTSDLVINNSSFFKEILVFEVHFSNDLLTLIVTIKFLWFFGWRFILSRFRFFNETSKYSGVGFWLLC